MSSPTKGKRKSLAALFTDMEITPASPSTQPPSPTKRIKMRSDLRNTISRGWPSMTMTKNSSLEQLSMTIRADGVYRQYSHSQDPEKLFEKAAQWINNVHVATRDEVHRDLIDKELHEALIRAIFGSNMIERAGLNLDITIQLCRRIFAGEDVGDISDRDPSYLDALIAQLIQLHPELKDMPAQYILRGRSEIVQHAKAYQHIINAFVVEKRDLTEELIKDTHRILTKGVPIIDPDHPEVPPEKYGGIYRTQIVGAGSTNFTVPKFVPAKMREMCNALKEELATAEIEKSIDPFSVAAKYSLKFVEIHPFQDGNGRLCRMILNAILCRYSGVIVPIGERGEEQEEYMGIKRRSSQNMEGHGEYAMFVLQKATVRLREMKKKLAGKNKRTEE